MKAAKHQPMASIDDLFEPSSSFNDEQMEQLIAGVDRPPPGAQTADASSSELTPGVDPFEEMVASASLSAARRGPGASISSASISSASISSSSSSSVEAPLFSTSASYPMAELSEPAGPAGPARSEDLYGAGLRRKRRWWPAALVVSLVGSGVTTWWLTRPPPPPPPPPPPEPVVIEAAPVGPPSEAAPGRLGRFEPQAPTGPRIELDGGLRIEPYHQKKRCRKRRERAAWAQARGDWGELDKATRDTACWHPEHEGVALRMNALFELGRRAECRRIGEGINKPAVRKWTQRCAELGR